MKRCAAALCWVAMVWVQTARSQTRCVVADIETRRPLKGVRVTTDTNATIETDTVLLLPTMLNEVVVYGKAPKPGFDLQEAARRSARIGAMKAPKGVKFDFFRMFDKSTRRPSKKEREMNERILKTY